MSANDPKQTFHRALVADKSPRGASFHLLPPHVIMPLRVLCLSKTWRRGASYAARIRRSAFHSGSFASQEASQAIEIEVTGVIDLGAVFDRDRTHGYSPQ